MGKRSFQKTKRKKEKDSANSWRITDLKGLGREIWKKIEAQDYVNKEREDWTNTTKPTSSDLEKLIKKFGKNYK